MASDHSLLKQFTDLGKPRRSRNIPFGYFQRVSHRRSSSAHVRRFHFIISIGVSAITGLNL
jgi:hypothetical protein